MKVKKFEPNFIATFKARNGRVVRVESKRKRKILSHIRTTFAKEGELKCIYGRGLQNAASFGSYTEAMKLLRDWTDKDMQEHILEGEW